MKKKEIYITSIGLNIEDISVKVVNLIKNSKLLITDFLFKKDENIIKIINPDIEIINLSDIHPTEHKEFAAFLFNEIYKYLKKYDRIIILTNGNPLYLNHTYIILYKMLKDKLKNTKIDVIPSVSSFDYVIDRIVKLGGGLTYRIYTYPFNEIFKNDAGVIIFNPNNISSYTFIEIKNMLRNYHQNHYFYLIRVKTVLEEEEIKKFKIKDFIKIIKTLDNRTTLYIPPLNKEGKNIK